MTYTGTWNIQSLFRLNSVTELVNELVKYKIMIDTIREIRWQGNNITDIGGYTMC
jgi:hypothetical protein